LSSAALTALQQAKAADRNGGSGARSPPAPPSLSVMQSANTDRPSHYGKAGLGMPRARVLVGPEGKAEPRWLNPHHLGTHPMRL
jgi:hypothetical protein